MKRLTMWKVDYDDDDDNDDDDGNYPASLFFVLFVSPCWNTLSPKSVSC